MRSAPKWRLDCNRCTCLVYLPFNAKRIETTNKKCTNCASTILQVCTEKRNPRKCATLRACGVTNV